MRKKIDKTVLTNKSAIKEGEGRWLRADTLSGE